MATAAWCSGPEIRSLELKDLCFLVTPFIDGPNIESFISEFTPSRDQLFDLFRRLLDALTYLHETKEYLHADIKPSNVLVRARTAEPVIIDLCLYQNLSFRGVDEQGEVDRDQFTRLLV
ncbi:MAG: hypothetical protein Q8P50_00795 [Bacillota bacterium]|nr:hypothetical protein [Bacillota bacterium]